MNRCVRRTPQLNDTLEPIRWSGGTRSPWTYSEKVETVRRNDTVRGSRLHTFPRGPGRSSRRTKMSTPLVPTTFVWVKLNRKDFLSLIKPLIIIEEYRSLSTRGSHVHPLIDKGGVLEHTCTIQCHFRSNTDLRRFYACKWWCIHFSFRFLTCHNVC